MNSKDVAHKIFEWDRKAHTENSERASYYVHSIMNENNDVFSEKYYLQLLYLKSSLKPWRGKDASEVRSHLSKMISYLKKKRKFRAKVDKLEEKLERTKRTYPDAPEQERLRKRPGESFPQWKKRIHGRKNHISLDDKSSRGLRARIRKGTASRNDYAKVVRDTAKKFVEGDGGEAKKVVVHPDGTPLPGGAPNPYWYAITQEDLGGGHAQYRRFRVDPTDWSSVDYSESDEGVVEIDIREDEAGVMPQREWLIWTSLPREYGTLGDFFDINNDQVDGLRNIAITLEKQGHDSDVIFKSLKSLHGGGPSLFKKKPEPSEEKSGEWLGEKGLKPYERRRKPGESIHAFKKRIHGRKNPGLPRNPRKYPISGYIKGRIGAFMATPEDLATVTRTLVSRWIDEEMGKEPIDVIPYPTGETLPGGFPIWRAVARWREPGKDPVRDEFDAFQVVPSNYIQFPYGAVTQLDREQEGSCVVDYNGKIISPKILYLIMNRVRQGGKARDHINFNLLTHEILQQWQYSGGYGDIEMAGGPTLLELLDSLTPLKPYERRRKRGESLYDFKKRIHGKKNPLGREYWDQKSKIFDGGSWGWLELGPKDQQVPYNKAILERIKKTREESSKFFDYSRPTTPIPDYSRFFYLTYNDKFGAWHEVVGIGVSPYDHRITTFRASPVILVVDFENDQISEWKIFGEGYRTGTKSGLPLGHFNVIFRQWRDAEERAEKGGDIRSALRDSLEIWTDTHHGLAPIEAFVPLHTLKKLKPHETRRLYGESLKDFKKRIHGKKNPDDPSGGFPPEMVTHVKRYKVLGRFDITFTFRLRRENTNTGISVYDLVVKSVEGSKGGQNLGLTPRLQQEFALYLGSTPRLVTEVDKEHPQIIKWRWMVLDGGIFREIIDDPTYSLRGKQFVEALEFWVSDMMEITHKEATELTRPLKPYERRRRRDESLYDFKKRIHGKKNPSPQVGDSLYHVTFTSKVPSIKKKGIIPFQDSNWVKAGDMSRYGEGEIYAFERFEDALKWAMKMDRDKHRKLGSGKISIVEIESGGDWEVDSADPISQTMTKGKWLKKFGSVSPDLIKGSKKVTTSLLKANSLLKAKKNPTPDEGIREDDFVKQLEQLMDSPQFPGTGEILLEELVKKSGGWKLFKKRVKKVLTGSGWEEFKAGLKTWEQKVPVGVAVPRIVTSYDIVTDESSRTGDVAEKGWHDEEGVSMEGDVVENALEFFDEKSVCGNGDEETYIERSKDVNTGAVTTYYYHLKNFKDKDIAELSEKMQIKGGVWLGEKGLKPGERRRKPRESLKEFKKRIHGKKNPRPKSFAENVDPRHRKWPKKYKRIADLSITPTPTPTPTPRPIESGYSWEPKLHPDNVYEDRIDSEGFGRGTVDFYITISLLRKHHLAEGYPPIREYEWKIVAHDRDSGEQNVLAQRSGEVPWNTQDGGRAEYNFHPDFGAFIEEAYLYYRKNIEPWNQRHTRESGYAENPLTAREPTKRIHGKKNPPSRRHMRGSRLKSVPCNRCGFRVFPGYERYCPHTLMKRDHPRIVPAYEIHNTHGVYKEGGSIERDCVVMNKRDPIGNAVKFLTDKGTVGIDSVRHNSRLHVHYSTSINKDTGDITTYYYWLLGFREDDLDEIAWIMDKSMEKDLKPGQFRKRSGESLKEFKKRIHGKKNPLGHRIRRIPGLPMAHRIERLT